MPKKEGGAWEREREGESEGDLIRYRCRLRKSVKTAITKTEGPDSETERGRLEGVEGKNSPNDLGKDLDTEGRQEVAMRMGSATRSSTKAGRRMTWRDLSIPQHSRQQNWIENKGRK